MMKKRRTDGVVEWYGSQPSPEFWEAQFGVAGRRSSVSARRGSRNAILEQALERAAPILEAGCGDGSVASWLNRALGRCDATDWSRPLVERVRTGDPSLVVFASDVTQLPVKSGVYRGYVSLGVIEHLTEDAGRWPLAAE